MSAPLPKPAPAAMSVELGLLQQRAAARDPQFATDFVSTVLRIARDAGASDVHIDPAAESLELRWRLDGVLQPLVSLPRDIAANVVARLKVLAGLLTYETALPQEGRLWDDAMRIEVRVSTFPTLFGERAVLRLLGASHGSLDSLAELGMPAPVLAELERHLAATSGAVLIVGPAGSGKTTSAYACLRHIVKASGGGRSIASLEDPVEVAVAGVVQSQVSAGPATSPSATWGGGRVAAEFDMATGLRTLLRLDPEVIFIGEMRDRTTAEIALQAALTGQLVLTTFHAGNSGEALSRLLDLGIPQYAVRNAVRLVVSQRLVRRLCTCARPGNVERDANPLGISVTRCSIPDACDACHQTGYRGRSLMAEWRTKSTDSDELELIEGGDLWSSARTLVEDGVTDAAEVVRVLGLPGR